MYNGCVFGCEIKGGICRITTETLCAKSDLQYLSKDGKILQAEGAAYLPCLSHSNDPNVKNFTEHKILLTRGKYLGTFFSDFIGGRTPAACMEMTSFMVMASKLLRMINILIQS